jgi:hypothetical protein
MKFTSITTLASLFLVSVSSAISALPVRLEVRDVFVPTILYPTAGTVWRVGDKHYVTWFVIHLHLCFCLSDSSLLIRDTSNHPVNITNRVGRIMLRKGDFTTPR